MNNIFKRNCVSLMQSILLLLYEWFITIKIYWFLILIYYMYETLPPAFVKLDVLLQNGIGPWLLQGLSIERQFIALITSLVVFCFTSSTAFFTFIYKENKEIAHSYTYENQSFRLFILNLTLNFWSLVLFYFSDSFEKKAFGLFIGFLFYGVFILLTLINIFSYQFVRFKLFLLTHYLIKLNNTNSKRNMGNRNYFLFILFFVVPYFVLYLIFRYKDDAIIHNIAFIIFSTLIVTLIRFVLRFYYPDYLINGINKNVINIIVLISYHNQLDRKSKEVIKKHLKKLLNEVLLFLFGNKKGNSYLNSITLNQRHANSLKYMYTDVIKGIKNLTINDTQYNNIIDKEFLLKFNPVLNVKKTVITQSLIDAYSNVYVQVISDTLIDTVNNSEKSSLSIIKSYREEKNSKFQEKNDIELELLQDISNKIEYTSMAEFVLKNNINGVIEICMPIVENSEIKTNEQKDDQVYFLLICLIKSLELMHFKIAGYLLKIMNVNYKPERIKDAFTTFFNSNIKENNIVDNKIDTLTARNKDIFFIQRHSLVYCFKKSYLLCLIYSDSKNVYKDVKKFGEIFDNKNDLRKILERIKQEQNEIGIIINHNTDIL